MKLIEPLKVNCEGCKSHCCGQIPGLTPALLPSEEERFKDDLDRHGNITTLKKKPDTGTCIFLDDTTNKCKIYDERPLECKLFPYTLDFDCSIPSLKRDNRCPQLSKIISDEVKLIDIIRNQDFTAEWIESYKKLENC